VTDLWYAISMKPARKTQEAPLVSDLARDLFALVSKLKRRLNEHTDVRDLTPSQVSVLMRIEKETSSITVSRLAQAEGMRPQSMAAIIAALDDAGLVRRAPDPTDGRQTLISLSDRYRKWARDGRTARQDWLSRAIQTRLAPQEQDKLAVAVDLLKRLTDD
jgi:DNA-binding MarR family transcriptional regulator